MQLIQSQNLTMSSREIAELTGKLHRNVIRDIRNMISELKDEPFLSNQFTELKDGRGYTSEFMLDRELTDCLLTGYSVVLRNRVIKRLRELEEQQAAPAFSIPSTLSGALRLAADQAEQYEARLIAEKARA